MRVLVLGIDGYIGWPLAMHLAKRGHSVYGIDNLSRRSNVASLESTSAIPIQDITQRISSFHRLHDRWITFYHGDLLDYDFLSDALKNIEPDSIVHLAEQPSAPYSMIDREHAFYTQHNNVLGTLNLLYAMKEICPRSHLVKLGTMGEYGTPNIDIPEGFFEIEYKGRKDTLPFPRQPLSIYHLSKVHDSANTQFACKTWGLRATDIMQGVVYGTRTAEMTEDSLMTRFDFDECFGTAINRFCAQAVIGHPLTPYGRGTQRRTFLNLEDSIQCLTITVENPAQQGQYRVFNQFDEIYSIKELADYVALAGKRLGLKVKITPVRNPRLEKDEHYYNSEHQHLTKLGFRPTRTISDALDMMLGDLIKYKDRISEKSHVILPKTTWTREKTENLSSDLLVAKTETMK